MNLKKQTVKGLIWTFSQQFSVKAINFIVQIILARLLIPEVFGLIAMIQIFISIGETLMDGGMTSSLIRTKHVDNKDYSSVFFVNLLTSVLIYILLFIAAPYVAAFFNQNLLTSLIRVYTLSFVIQALAAVQTTKLTKELNFKLQMIIQIPSAFIGGVFGVLLAYKGYGVWSIVFMNLITTSLFMIQLWLRSNWRPSFVIDKEKLKHHFIFGYKLTLSGLLTNIYANLYTFIIGKFFSATQLGFYNQANNLRMFPVSNLTSALQKVTYPVFSLIQEDNILLKKVFKRITNLVFFIVAPLMLFLVLIAEPLFRFVLTEKWLPAVPYFQLLSISAIAYPLSMYNLNIILAKGRSDLHLKMEVLKKISSLFFLLLIIPFGIWGVIYAQAISMLIHAFVNTYYCGILISYSVKHQFFDLFPILASSSFVLLLVYFCDIFLLNDLIKSDVIIILVNLVLYFTLYLFISKLFRIRGLVELINMVKPYMKKLNYR